MFSKTKKMRWGNLKSSATNFRLGIVVGLGYNGARSMEMRNAGPCCWFESVGRSSTEPHPPSNPVYHTFVMHRM